MAKIMVWIKPEPKHLIPTQWWWICSYPHMLKIGRFSDIGCMTYLQAEFGIDIGERVLIGSHCSFFTRDDIGNHSGPIKLHNGCKVGTHSTIMANCEIGPNLTIPAYSFVKKSILTQQDLDEFLMKENKRPFNFEGLL